MKKNKIIKILIGIILLTGVIILMCLLIGKSPTPSNGGYWPDDGVVPNESVALKIAEAVWLPIYGDKIYSQQPFTAEYDENEGYWYVRGSLPRNTEGRITVGGVAEIKINKSDGKILYINHGK